MIKDEKIRDELFKKFPKLTAEIIRDVQWNYMEQYSLYRRLRKGVYKCRCTACGKEYTLGKELERVMEMSPDILINHKDKGVCPECKTQITYLAEGRGKKYIWENQYFAVFNVVEENLYISCYDVIKKFSNDGRRLIFDWVENHRYCLTPNGAQHWRDYYELHDNHWMKWWKPLKSEHGATFYTYINEDIVSDTFLKYVDDTADLTAYEHYITFLCMCSNHLNIEYLIKAGFGYIIKSKLLHGSADGVRINYRSNNVKTMLGLNKTEMELLKDKNCKMLSAYFQLRKADKSIDERERAEFAEKYTYYCDRIIKIMATTGLSLRKVMNYIGKQKCQRNVIYDWEDYLKQCQELKYDVSDTLISMPKNLSKAHSRLTRIIEVKANEAIHKKLEEKNEERKKFAYESIYGDLCVVVPESVQQIIGEGKRLDHCVGGYAQRHAEGKLTILFLRTTAKPDVPYYTMEVSKDGEIIQCRGYKNNSAGNRKPKRIEDFELEYQKYLDKVFKKKRRKTA